MTLRQFGLIGTFIVAFPVAALAQGPTAPPGAMVDADLPFTMTEMARFDFPWSMAFLPGGKILVTQKKGALILFDPATGASRAMTGVPAVVTTNQAGLMDIALAPDFARSRRLYVSFVEAGAGKTSGVALASALLDEAGGVLRDVTILFRTAPYVERASSYSGRIALSPDGRYLFFTSGERVQPDQAQDRATTLGKVLRLRLDGMPASGNPLARRGFHPAIWSYGHRNPSGLAFGRGGRLWSAEMGPAGGDEVNLIRAGANYGWPLASNGTNYDGSDIPDHRRGDGFAAPGIFWTPSLSPGSLAHYDGKLFPAWRNSLFVTGLSGMALVRIALRGDSATKADHWAMGMRLRNVRAGPDGALWLLEDAGKGRLLRLTPRLDGAPPTR